jgi:hypothetical protein
MGALWEGIAFVASSVEDQHVIEFRDEFGFPNLGTLYWIPRAVGTYQAGDNLGDGVGTLGGDLHLTAFVKREDETFYAYSSHVYGYREDGLIPGSGCTIRVDRHEGEFVTYRQSFGSVATVDVTQFIGVIEGVFAGTFISEAGVSAEVTNGEFRIENELPEGVTVLE